MIEQGSDEWHTLRLGKATASRISDIIATTKSGYSTSRANYASELVVERLTNTRTAGYENDAMRWGKEKEAEARTAYEFYLDSSVEQVAFIDHSTIAMSGCSPDGLVGKHGLVEIKCPFKTAVHINTLLRKEVPSEYLAQIQWQMAVTHREWCDFASYDPRLPENMRLFTKRVDRDVAEIMRLEREVKLFLGEVDETIAKLNRLYGDKAAA